MKKLFYFCAVLALALIASCAKSEADDKIPPEGLLTDLSSELSDEERLTEIAFRVSLTDILEYSLEVQDMNGKVLFSEAKSDFDILSVFEKEYCIRDLMPETKYTVSLHYSNHVAEKEDSLTIETAAAPVAPEYLVFNNATASMYSFTVNSTCETGFYFSSGETGAIPFLVENFDENSQEKLKELLFELYPFSGQGSMEIICADGEQPSWAEIPIEVNPDSEYFAIAADKDASGNVIGQVHYITFRTK